MEQQKRCIDLVQDKFNEQEANYQKAIDFFDEYDNATEGEQIALKVASEYAGDYFADYDCFLQYASETALAWDYVAPFTFLDQKAGYFRLQLSWGGPSDEFRIYTDMQKDIKKIEYWYMDWGDGAFIDVPKDSNSWYVCKDFLEMDCS